METTYELVRCARSLTQGRPGSLNEIFNLTLNDIFFQIQLILCDENKINDELERFYIGVSKGRALLDNPNNVAQWLNESAVAAIVNIFREKYVNQLTEEKLGAYKVPMYVETYLTGDEIPDVEFIKTLSAFICTLPELHRMTALAFYYDGLPMDKITELFERDSATIKARLTYIEKILGQKIHAYCEQRGYSAKSINPQKIRQALTDLAKLYSYPYGDILYNNVVARLNR